MSMLFAGIATLVPSIGLAPVGAALAAPGGWPHDRQVCLTEGSTMLAPFRIPLALFRRFYHRLWMRVTLYAVLALVVALVSALVEDYVPDGLADRIGDDAVMPVLTVLASSMLVVSTFSLNVMVSAHRAAATNATPRIHRLLLDDTTTQSVLATFIGAFVFALTSIVLFRVGAYNARAAVVVMAVTVIVVALVIVAILRWVEHLSTLGSLDASMRTANDQARRGLEALARDPSLGANPLTAETVLPAELTPVPAAASGYVQIIDVARLNALASEHGAVYVCRETGHHVLRGEPVAQVSGHVPPEALTKMAGCFVTGDMRTFEKDPEFGLLALSEIASRALSPGINDPGTAIEALTRLETLLWDHAHARDEGAAQPTCCTRVFLPVPSAERLIEAAFGATARDGAGMIEVALQLRQALLALARGPDAGFATAAEAMAGRALAYAQAALPLEEEKERLIAIRA